MPQSYYELLGVASDSSVAEIRKAYRRKIRDNHPDLNPDQAKAERRTKRLNVALEVLTDPDKRRKYDEKLKRKRGQSGTTGANKKNNAGHSQQRERSGSEQKQNGSGFSGFDSSSSSERSRNSSSKSTKSRGGRTFILLASIMSAGVSAFCVAILGLWVFLRVDPTGLIGAQPHIESEEIGKGPELVSRQELEDLKKQLDRLAERMTELNDANAKSNNETQLNNRLNTFSANLKRLEIRQDQIAQQNASKIGEPQAWTANKEQWDLIETRTKGNQERVSAIEDTLGQLGKNKADMPAAVVNGKRRKPVKLLRKDGFEQQERCNLPNGEVIEDWVWHLPEGVSTDKPILNVEDGTVAIRGKLGYDGFGFLKINKERVFVVQGGRRKTKQDKLLFQIRHYAK